MLLAYHAFSQSANFSYTSSSNSFCSPATIRFTNNSNGRPNGYLWNFGNGQKSNATNPVITFTSAGTFRVRLVAVYNNFTSEITKEIIIKPGVYANITSDRDKLCTPGAVQFNAATNTPTSTYEWNFGDNTPSVNTSNNSVNHNYAGFGSYTANLTITNSNGCKAIASKVIEIAEPEISGFSNLHSGCVPAVNSLSASVQLINNSTISNYQWEFGDGTMINNTLYSVIHTYENAGVFAPKLTITTAEGCSKSFIFDSIKYGLPPVNLMARSLENEICANEKATLFAHAQHADEYEWNFGNGNILTTADTVIQYKFTSLGLKNIIVTPKMHDCYGQPDTLTILVKGPIAKFNYRNTCSNKNTFQFQNTSQGRNLQYIWDFGAPLNGSLVQPNSYTFPTSGTYQVSLIVNDTTNGCADTMKTTIYTADPVLLNNKHTLCINSSSQFKILNTYQNPAATYTWNILGTRIGPNTDTVLAVIANLVGTYDNSVIINNGRAYCPDTIELNHRMMVKGPNVNFEAENSICQEKPLIITNLSTPYLPGDSIKKFYWSFGDNTGTIYGQLPTPHQYTAEGTYNIVLTAVDINGCKDSTSKQIHVRPMPFVWIIPKNKTFCQGDENSMIAYTSDNLLWSTSLPLQQFCHNCDTNLIRPEHSITFFATATNNYNCVAVDSSSIKIMEPFTATTTTPQIFICEKDSAMLNAGPADKIALWSPALDLNNAENLNPIVTPSANRRYKVTLQDSLGCFNSNAEIEVTVKTNPKIELGPTRFLPYQSSFMLKPKYDEHAARFEWTPAIDLSCSNCPNPVTFIDKTKNYELKVTSDSGCVSTDNVTLAVECAEAYILVPSAFTPNNDGINDIFYPMAKGIKHINRFAIYNRSSQLVFEENNFTPNSKNFGWDGKFKASEQPAGAYVYYIEAACDLGQTTIKKGSFLLIR